MGNLALSFIAAAIAASLSPSPSLAAQHQKRGSSHSELQGSSSRAEVRSSKLIGATLNGSDGAPLGKVEDLIVNPASGKIDFAIVGFDSGGGTEALAPVPWQAVKLQSEKSFTASIDQNKLKSGPRLSQQEWEKLMQPDYSVQIYKFYGLPEEGMGGSDQESGGSQNGSGESDKLQPGAPAKPSSAVRKKL